jgi:hypothetical protein
MVPCLPGPDILAVPRAIMAFQLLSDLKHLTSRQNCGELYRVHHDRRVSSPVTVCYTYSRS